MSAITLMPSGTSRIKWLGLWHEWTGTNAGWDKDSPAPPFNWLCYRDNLAIVKKLMTVRVDLNLLEQPSNCRRNCPPDLL